jgi:TetR/AcrR family transcriptional regulator, transcriptional repressor for nem operon
MQNLSTKADEILRSASDLIISVGYNGFSYADISDAVGIRKASIHHHFATKADLVRSVVSHYRAEVLAAMGSVEANIPDPVARLRAYTGHWEACIRDDRSPFCICAMLAAEIAALPTDVAAEVRGHFRDLAAWVAATMEEGVRQGRMSLPRTAGEEAATFIATVHGAMLSARVAGGAEIFATIVEPLFERISARH